jgi:hypothetical protein
MTTLEDLYYGNISPHERYIKRGTRVDKLLKSLKTVKANCLVSLNARHSVQGLFSQHA